MSMTEEIKRWTAKPKSALVLDIIQGKTTVAEVSRGHDLSPSEIEQWVDDAKRGMENVQRANTLDIKEAVSSRSCKRPVGSRCWSFVHEKNAGPVGRGREVTLQIQQ